LSSAVSTKLEVFLQLSYFEKIGGTERSTTGCGGPRRELHNK